MRRRPSLSRPRAEASLASVPGAPPHQELPRSRTTFVGRDGDLIAIRKLVEDGAQLVTLLGTPGIGKTRLSLQAARCLGGDATFCDISGARDATALLTAVALALGAPAEALSSGDGLTGIVGRALRQRGETLLVLDNAEQVVADAASAVSRWMDAAPSALFLVTSRERLRIAGEHVLELGPLEIPPRHETSPERLLASEAVTLLIDRARAVRASFSAAPADAATLAEIVRRVEGVPLAIELCAARLGMLEPRQLLARL
ncbi:MAG: AAA family ATPase, partial [Byssovorax sp.]